MSRLMQRNGAWYVDYSDERKKRVRKKLEGVRSKREAEARLAELVTQVTRRQLGLEPAAVSVRSTVWHLVDWWLTNRCPARSQNNERRRLTKHLRDSELGRMPVAHARSSHFEAWFSELERPREELDGQALLGPASINHLRSKLRTAFERARREDVFSGKNPLQDTKKRRVPKGIYETLSAEEAVQVLAKVPPQWRGFIAAAIYLALRKGEIAGLLKQHVDLKRMQLKVARSYERETTKGGHGDLLPIPDVMRPYLEVALKSPGLLLFGDARGRMRKPNSKPDVTLRRALKHANICIGYRLICRRCTPDGKLAGQVVAERPMPPPKCPVCTTRKLWVTPLPRHVRFHDLRHSTATILLREGVDAHRVQKLMRHASFDTTSRTYAHLIVEDLRAGQAVAFGGRGELDLENADRAELVAEVVRLRRLLASGPIPAPTPSPHASPRKESIAT
jgi:integrase